MQRTDMILRYFLVALCAISLATAEVSAQTLRPTVRAHITPDSIMIGDRFTLEIEVERDIMQIISYPSFNASAEGAGETGDAGKAGGAGGEGSIECIEELPEDTLSANGRRLHLRKRYIMAAFDEGIYSFGKAKVLYVDKNIVDTLYAEEELRIAVATFQIDSTSHAIFDIKPQKNLPFRFGEISGYLLWTLLAAAILGAVVYGIVRWLHKRGRRVRDIFKAAPPLPPHVVAITALENLHNQKLWQNNRHKQYYSGLSDILRTYIAGRYGVGAMEMTTDEIIAALHDEQMPPKSAMDLVAVLRDSDLVKFAKAMPDADENEIDYQKAYWFVEETKPVEITEEESPTPNKESEEGEA